MEITIEIREAIKEGYEGKFVFKGEDDWDDWDFNFCCHGIKLRWSCCLCEELMELKKSGRDFS